jgi:hypothetical protein
MASISGGVNPNVQIAYAVPSGIAVGQSLQIPLSLHATINPGTGAGQCDRLYAVTLSLAAAAQTVLLQNFTDILGNTGQSMAKIRLIAWRNQSTTDGQIVSVGNAATHPFAGMAAAGAIVFAYPTYAPGTGTNFDGFTLWTAPTSSGMPVTSTTNQLMIDPGANTMLFDLIIAGTSV